MPVYHFIESENIDESIHQFVIENQMNWLVVVPHKHSFFEGLFHKSHTKAMTRKLQIPVISLHEKAHTT
jgi:nucleotide-binding universal stress UspA family protein